MDYIHTLLIADDDLVQNTNVFDDGSGSERVQVEKVLLQKVHKEVKLISRKTCQQHEVK